MHSEFISLGAPIIDFDAFAEKRAGLGKIVMTSGFFDPVHPGHISCFQESKQHGDTLVVVINGDSAARLKKGRPFQPLTTRCSIVSSLRSVDYVIPFEIENDASVCVALEKIRPHVFTKGGDRTGIENIPEWGICQDLGIEIITDVGLAKLWSSSTFLREWEEFISQREVDHTTNV